jgi:hypothetical protein
VEPVSGDVAAEAPETVADSADAEVTAPEATAPEAAAPEAAAPEATAPEATAPEATVAVIAASEEPAIEPKGRGRRSRDKKATDIAELPTDDTAELAVVAEPANLVVEPDADATLGAAEGADPDPEPASPEPVAEAAVDIETAADTEVAADSEIAADTEIAAHTETSADTPEVQGDLSDDVRFEPPVFTIADLSEEAAADPSGMGAVEAREATEFVPARLDIDIDSLRGELAEIATAWLGEDGAPVTRAIAGARAGVDDFVSTIRAIGAMEIPGHETAVVRAMAREMHFRATEVLTGV